MVCTVNEIVMFNNAACAGMKIATVTRHDIHPSFERLMSVAMANGVHNSSALAVALNDSPQTITNWTRRGVSRDGALKAQEKFGISASWLLTGVGPELFRAERLAKAEAAEMALMSPPSISHALKVLADAAGRLKPAERGSAAGLLRELILDPHSNAADLIPIIARRLS